ncbi:MAG: M1 family metallopeptidase [Reichenbachiella sp.]
MIRRIFLISFLTIVSICIQAQNRWQQRVEYLMEVDLNVETNQLIGKQNLTYYNNSPDTLGYVFFHLYFNAFQPGSMMDVRNRSVVDPDKRVKDRIYYLKENEIGFQKIKSFTQEGNKLKYAIEGTVMKVKLSKPLLPNSTTEFKMQFESQIPLQIRRTGRDNKEGIRYSIGQWYPKMAEYDRSGWHADQYVGREFYSPWGDFDVKINIDSAYTVAAGGVLQNPEEIGKGYSKAKATTARLTYHFKAENVHDFMWAADPDFVHDIVQMKADLKFHYFYKKDTLNDNWATLQSYMLDALPFIEDNFGEYPYPVYSFIQGGDGGMEYPMATLITGHRNISSLVAVSIHEFIHSWFQMMLGTNENYYYWMDEGFTSYGTNLTKEHVFKSDNSALNPHANNFKKYLKMVNSGNEEPLTTHADRLKTTSPYWVSSYSKGAITLRQLEGIMGKEVFKKALLRYCYEWRFKHPDEIDFMRVMEKQSGLELDWYFNYWIKTTKTIDYGLKNVSASKKGTKIQLEKIGEMPMPLEIKVTLNNGREEWYQIALSMMLGHKSVPKEHIVLSNWPWVNDYYSFVIDNDLEDIKSIEIDPNQFIADLDRDNNRFPLKSSSLEINGVPIKLNNLD